MTYTRILAAASLLLLAACATTAPTNAVFTITDPRGDDHGDGSIVYPANQEIVPGDLDLVQISAYPAQDGTTFEATFANKIKTPWRRTIDSVGTSLDAVARLGFYTFNIDIYIDTDRIAGSGSVATLPGRKATIEPANAWERVICLTPRPLDSRAALRRLLTREGVDKIEKEAKTLTPQQLEEARRQLPLLVDEHVFFPTSVDVQGNRIRFFVPDSFFNAPVSPKWSYVVGVTGSDLNLVINLFGANESATSMLAMIPIRTGRPQETFGHAHEDDVAQPQFIEVMVGGPRTQEQILADYDPRGTKLATLPGITPAEQ